MGHVAAVRCVQYDGRRVVSGAYDFMVKVWDPETETCLHTLQGHTNRVYSLQVNKRLRTPDSHALITQPLQLPLRWQINSWWICSCLKQEKESSHFSLLLNEKWNASRGYCSVNSSAVRQEIFKAQASLIAEHGIKGYFIWIRSTIILHVFLKSIHDPSYC